MKEPLISIGSWAFSFGPFADAPWPLEKFLKYASQTGFDGIELNGFRPHPHQDDYDTPEKCRELKNKITDLGLGISGYAPDFSFTPPSLAETGTYLEIVQKCLFFCTQLEIDILRVDTVSPPDELSKDVYEERFKHLANIWHVAAEECRKEGVLLVWEFEPGFWLNKPSEVKKTVEAVGHENFKLLLYTAHA